MSAAHVQTKTAHSGSTTALNVSLTGVTAGNHLAAGSIYDNATSSLTTSTPSATWNNAIDFQPTGFATKVRVDYSENVASGSWTVTLNQPQASALTGVVSESSGVKTSSSLGATPNKNSAASSPASLQTGSLTPTAGSIVYTWVEVDMGSGSSASTIDSSFTVTSDPAGGAGTCWDSAFQPGGNAALGNVSGAALNPTWTPPSGSGTTDMAAVIVEFLAAAGGGAAPTIILTRTLRGVGI